MLSKRYMEDILEDYFGHQRPKQKWGEVSDEQAKKREKS